MATQSEQALEDGLIASLCKMDYEYVRLHEETNLIANFKRQLEKHNQSKLAEIGRTEFTDEEFNRIMLHLEGGSRFEKAKKLRDLYTLEIDNGQHIWVEFLNRKKWCQNEFQVANQITVEGRKECRYDVTILINGLPLVQIELKKRGKEIREAYNQVQRYIKTSYHGLFDYIQIFVISNGVNTRYFANNPNSGFKFTFNWTDKANVRFNDLSSFTTHFFDKCTLGKILGKYIVMHESEKCLMVMRPYQFYAVEEIIEKVKNSTTGGYIWHTTGAGKTLTSFKAAQLVAEQEDVDKVMFVVDRHDLDTQTQTEYEAFEPGAVDGTDNTDELVKRLSSNSKIIITTIQKLNTAVSKEWYNKKLEKVRGQRIVMIFDECHRSHFGESHKNIMKFFHNTQCFGFTGTPIFAENSVDKHTTKEVFGDCLHKYLISDAIADQNVLGFLIQYYNGNDVADKLNEKRMTEIAKYVLENFNKSTFDGEFDALFAVQSVPMLIKYYKIFKSLKPNIRISAVFTYAANEDQDDEFTGTGKGFADDHVAGADDLQEIMDDYNAMYGTAFTTDNFRAYYDDINLRLKKKKDGMEPLDLCLVVGMFLTGFDSKKLNTLYVDKELKYHSLLQAFSRTNRVLNDKKRFGKIVCFRDLKENVDTSLKLFSNKNNLEDITRPSFAQVKKEYTELTTSFLERFPDPQEIDSIQSENEKLAFVLAFRDIIRKHAEIQIYNEFEEDDPELGLDEQLYMDFRSKYLDMYDQIKEDKKYAEDQLNDKKGSYEGEQSIEDVDFCLELLHSDVVNVAYILTLIENLDPDSDDYDKRRQEILDTIIKDSEMRNKIHLVDGFIKHHIDDRENYNAFKKDGANADMEERLLKYVRNERDRAVEELAYDSKVDMVVLHKFLDDYSYSRKENTDIIKEALKEQHLGLLKRNTALRLITKRLKKIFNIYSWD